MVLKKSKKCGFNASVSWPALPARPDFTGEVRGGGSGGTGRGRPATKSNFVYEIHFKHGLPHDVESIRKKM